MVPDQPGDILLIVAGEVTGWYFGNLNHQPSSLVLTGLGSMC